MKFLFPKRFSREKRKALRVVAIRAWHWEMLRAALKTCIDRVWGDMEAAPTWSESVFALTGRTFVDDAEFLP